MEKLFPVYACKSAVAGVHLCAAGKFKKAFKTLLQLFKTAAA